MRARLSISVALALAWPAMALAGQVTLTPVDDGQIDRTQFGNPYVLSNPPGNGYLYAQEQLSTTGEWHDAYIEYSLASLPAGATITSATFTYQVQLISTSSNGQTISYPSLSINLYDGGDGLVTLADSSKSTFNVAQSQDLTTTGVYTTSFFSVIPLNGRGANFPGGYLGLEFAPRVEGLQTGVYTMESAAQFSVQAPVINLTFSVPEPATVGVLGIAGLMLVDRRKARRASVKA